LALAVLLAGWSGIRRAIVVGVGLIVVWGAAAGLIAAGVHDVDGFMDCWPGCTARQQVVGFAFFASPALLVVLLAGGLAAWLKRRAIELVASAARRPRACRAPLATSG
jgi:hypothetical protein